MHSNRSSADIVEGIRLKREVRAGDSGGRKEGEIKRSGDIPYLYSQVRGPLPTC